MYDDLVKRLRELPHLLFVQLHGHEDIVYKAAVAIEVLNKQIDELQKQVAYWQAQLTKSMCGETLAELERPRWIPVTEGLPEPYTWVLVCAENHKVAFDAFYDGARWKDAVLNGLIVTHWMPLPEPPKEEVEE